jgi:serine/threonine protein phosphatase PrpC
MRYLPSHAQHIGSRSYQQDSAGFADLNDEGFLRHGGFLSVLCDGMGGLEHGDVASQTAVRAFLDAYAEKIVDESIPEALERSARYANRRVIEEALKFGLREGVGTTLVAAAIRNRSLYFLSVGDSAIYHVRKGKAQMLNRSHVYANLLDEAAARGKMTAVEAEQHPEREALTSFIGIHALDEIDRNLEAVVLAEGDTVLLATDGMFKTLDPVEISACLRGHPQSWPRALVAATLTRRRPGQDNVTVVSITPDSGALAEWIPPLVDDGISPVAPTARSASNKRGAGGAWLAVVTFLLLAAAGAGGFWYFSTR